MDDCSENTNLGAGGRSRCYCLDCNFITEGLDTIDSPANNLMRIKKVMKAGTEVLIDSIVLKHRVYSDQDAMSYSDNGTFLAATPAQAMVEARVVAILHPKGCPGNLYQDRAEPGIPMASFATPMLSGALVIDYMKTLQ